MIISHVHFIVFPDRAGILCDSIAKHVRVDRVHTHAYRGYSVSQVSDQVRFGNVSIAGYTAVLLHLGTNDIANLTPDTTFDEVMGRFQNLVSMLNFRNRSIVILIAGILPRPKDFENSKFLIWGLNNALQSWCCLCNYLIFVPCHKHFFRNGIPRKELYSVSDLLHLNGAGVEILERAFREALSPVNLTTRLHWKRRPLVTYSPNAPRKFWMKACTNS